VWRLLLGSGLVLALGCGSPPSAPPRAARPDLAASLLLLAEQSLEAGHLEAAEDRFARALEADPGSAAARVGLGRVALARGDLAGAAAHFERALERAPGAADARLGLAKVAGRQGHAAEARAHLDQALALDPWRAETHAEFAALTGPAPRAPAGSLDEALRRANAHPYDLRAGLVAAAGLAQAGRSAEAARRLESLLWLSDLDPGAARSAWGLLTRVDPAYRDARIVRVHSFADQTIRARPGWEFRLRLAWLGASRALGPLLGVRFLPMTMRGFESSAASASLGELHAAFRAQFATRTPKRGVLALFTERPPSRSLPGDSLGQAEFLGRRLAVRLEPAPEPGPNRVLLHELLHLYGGVHVADDVESLMNPSGGGRVLDPMNARIVRELRTRRFGTDLDADVLDRIDLEATTRAYEDALRANLALRRAGLSAALELATTSRLEARRLAAGVRELDPHLADVARFVSALLWRGERRASAAFLLETASRLYGPATPRGKKAAAEAERIWDEILTGTGDGRKG